MRTRAWVLGGKKNRSEMGGGGGGGKVEFPCLSVSLSLRRPSSAP